MLDSDIPITCDREFLAFQTYQEPDYVVKFQEVSKLDVHIMEPTAEETGFRVYITGKSCIRQFVDINNVPYAISENTGNGKTVTVKYLQSGVKNISHTGGAFFHIGWEDLLIRERRIILHACCVDTFLGGILFSGVSGIGKSTQGRLWHEWENARLINGDRPVLYRSDDGWIAYGSPYAGSSKCHVNEHVDIRAIVMLAQKKTCSVRRLGMAEAFRRVFAQLTIGIWNSESIEIACDLSEKLISEVPVYELACTPDRNAVNLLKETLIEEVMSG